MGFRVSVSFTHLCHPNYGRKRRRPRSRGTDRRGTIPNMTSIHMRPPEVDERVIPGHWEGDLIKGARNASAVGTLVERTSLFVTLAATENASAPAAVTGFSTVLNRVDAQRRLSLTYDQGKEMVYHEQLGQNTGVDVYFADPHSPWQRGTNENTNGLLRQYLPKGEDLSAFSQPQLDEIAWQRLIKFKYAPRYLADFRYRFNRRYNLRSGPAAIAERRGCDQDLDRRPAHAG